MSYYITSERETNVERINQTTTADFGSDNSAAADSRSFVKGLTHRADQDDTLDLVTLVLQQSGEQLHSWPPHVEVKLLKQAGSQCHRQGISVTGRES